MADAKKWMELRTSILKEQKTKNAEDIIFDIFSMHHSEKVCQVYEMYKIVEWACGSEAELTFHKFMKIIKEIFELQG